MVLLCDSWFKCLRGGPFWGLQFMKNLVFEGVGLDYNKKKKSHKPCGINNCMVYFYYKYSFS